MNGEKPLRILHVTGVMNRAGTETLLMNLYRKINRDQVQFDFISYKPTDAHYDEEIRRMGGRVIKLRDPHSVWELYQAIKKNGPYEAVHGHLSFHCGITALAARLAGIKVRISHAHTTWEDDKGWMRKMYLLTMKKLIQSCSSHLLSCSSEAATYLFGNEKSRKDKYIFFPNIIDYENFLKEPVDEVKQFKTKHQLEGHLVIGHIGRFIESKNHRFLLQVLSRLVEKNKNVKLLLVGDGDLHAEIQKEAVEEGLAEQIVFAGLREDIHTMLHSMDVFVFPSIYEGLGLVLLEAQAAGLPCVVSEAIQPEADLGLGLVKRASLQQSPDYWANLLLELSGQKLHEEDQKVRGFIQNGNDYQSGVGKLLNIYQVSWSEKQ
ncbi:glycosyltransferase family 1 protein [Fictibacillus nanhaiensis]|uniref:glycosyltransferase family 1 protein n=1 Tax=Fictibacillus nanhaiensis TaxID=742169 RepID=UPI002E1B8095|nr:glycosyltransferase family 1 protein [Fictibacillus nanhaiensis]